MWKYSRAQEKKYLAHVANCEREKKRRGGKGSSTKSFWEIQIMRFDDRVHASRHTSASTIDARSKCKGEGGREETYVTLAKKTHMVNVCMSSSLVI